MIVAWHTQALEQDATPAKKVAEAATPFVKCLKEVMAQVEQEVAAKRNEGGEPPAVD